MSARNATRPIAGLLNLFTAAAITSLVGPTFADTALAAQLGETCGGFLVIPCDEGLWCEPEPGCGLDVGGTCVAVPAACSEGESQPVCGCDGYTYANDCERLAGRVEKMAEGACPPGMRRAECNSVVDVVCGTTDGKRGNYTNECWAKAAGATSIVKGTCAEP
jgi:hypothetical protein